MDIYEALQVMNIGGERARTIRVSDDLWEAAKKRSYERGENVSHAVREFLVRYTR